MREMYMSGAMQEVLLCVLHGESLFETKDCSENLSTEQTSILVVNIVTNSTPLQQGLLNKGKFEAQSEIVKNKALNY